MLEAGAARYAELKNLIVWSKDNGGSSTTVDILAPE
jgi:hypothetical protein